MPTSWNTPSRPTATPMTSRTLVNTPSTVRDPIWLLLLTDSSGGQLTDSLGNLLYSGQVDTIYTVRTPI